MKIISILRDINTKKLIFILFILSIIAPSLAVIIHNPAVSPGSDQVDYNQIAIGILEGKGFGGEIPVVGFMKMPHQRHPLYPFFIAVVYFFTNKSVIAVKILQILMHGLTCVIIFLISEKIFNNRLTSLGAGIIWALYPAAIFQSVFLLTETPFTFLLALSVLFILRFNQSPNLKNGCLCGLFLGLTLLTKSLILAFMPFLFIWMIYISSNRLMFKLRNFLLIMLFMFLTLSPWLIRNYIVLGDPFFIASGSGLSFYRYNNEKTLEVINTPLREAFPFTEEQKKELSILPEPEIDKYLYKLAWQFIRSHPKEFLRIRLAELNYFWHLWPQRPKEFTDYYLKEQRTGIPKLFLDGFLDRFVNRLKNSYFLYFCKILYHLPYNILFVGMLISFFGSFKMDKKLWRASLLLFFLIATVNTVYIFHHGSDRYRFPIDPYVFILGSHGLMLFYGGLKRRKI